jgi:hypothetical protein
MAKILSDAARSQYDSDGYYFPIDVLSPGEVAQRRAALEAFEQRQGTPSQVRNAASRTCLTGSTS